jgi:hypothetical protein
MKKLQAFARILYRALILISLLFDITAVYMIPVSMCIALLTEVKELTN